VTEPETNPAPESADAASPSDDSPGEAQPPQSGSAALTAAPAVATPIDLTNDPLFEALWAKVLAAWDDDKIHGAVLEYSVTAERLPDLAGRYRALKDHPVKGARAKKRLDAIIIAATQLMMSMKTSAKTAIPLSITLTVAGILACALVFAAYAMFHR
jgi:hypothetical protein